VGAKESAGLQQIEEDSPARDLRVTVALRVILPGRLDFPIGAGTLRARTRISSAST